MPVADREDVRVEDDVLGVEAGTVDQQPVRALADRDLAFHGVGLALLVEGHDDDRRAVAPRAPRLLEERALAFLHRDRVDDALALEAAESRLDHRPFRRVDHDRHARDVGLRRGEIQESHHRGLRIEHALVHVDVDHLRAVRHLVARDRERRDVVARLDQLAELRGARDVRALADVDEEHFGFEIERLETRQPAAARRIRGLARRQARDGARDVRDVLRRRAAAAADDVDEPALRPIRRAAPRSRRPARRIRRRRSAGRHSDRR